MVSASQPIRARPARLTLRTSVKILTWLRQSVRETERKKKAFLIGINYERHERESLKDPQRDVESMKHLLIKRYNFLEKDIILLSDVIGGAEELMPIYDNIIRHLQEFIKNDDGRTDYVFVYSGHSWQRAEDAALVEDREEEDGQEEFIIPCDALLPGKVFNVDSEKVVTDKELKSYLVKRLAKGSQLVAFFDSCHSGTLLNLKHYRCNRTGDFLSLFQNTTRRLFIEPLYSRASKSNAPGTLGPSTIKKTDTMSSTAGKPYYIPGKGKIFCHGFCPRLPLRDKPQVICVSACKDREYVVEPFTILPAIVKLLDEKPNPTYRELMRAARSGIEPKRKEMTDKLKANMKKNCHWPLNYLVTFHRRCFTDEDMNLKQMAKSSCKPQLSSRKPLNTKERLRL